MFTLVLSALFMQDGIPKNDPDYEGMLYIDLAYYIHGVLMLTCK